MDFYSPFFIAVFALPHPAFRFQFVVQFKRISFDICAFYGFGVSKFTLRGLQSKNLQFGRVFDTSVKVRIY